LNLTNIATEKTKKKKKPNFKSIATVKLSKEKPQFVLRESESIHLPRIIFTELLSKPTSYSAKKANRVASTKKKEARNWPPKIPSFLPNSPSMKKDNNGKKIINKYILKFYKNTAS
jgi:hypothetical protein